MACDPGAAIKRLGKCRAFKVKDGGTAFDGDTCTVWNAGAPPTQAIAATVETVDRVDAMILVPEMTRTTESPSWVAWREIVLVACDERVTVPAGMREVTPIPPRAIVAGTGACKTDADCTRER